MIVEHMLPTSLRSITALVKASNGGAEHTERLVEIGHRRRLAGERKAARRLQHLELDSRV